MANIKPIVTHPADVLRKNAKNVPPKHIDTPEIQMLICDMKETLKSTTDGVGLAAPQIGVALRLFVVSEEAEEINKLERNPERDLDEKEEPPYEKRDWRYDVYINPIVKRSSQKKLEDAEGCLSVPGKFGVVKRVDKITVEAYDEKGKKFVKNASRFVARVIQHELDHLEGKLFIDRAERFIDVEKKEKSLSEDKL